MSKKDNAVGTVFWITGLANVGKTTVGKRVAEKLQAQKRNAVFLDGDILRQMFGHHFGYSREERLKLARIYANLCQEFSSQGLDVVCATISLFHEIHEWNRTYIPSYREIFLTAPEDQRLKRSGTVQKDLSSGNVVGVDIVPEFPQNPDIVICNDQTITPEETALKIMEIEGKKRAKAA
ncbi:MAG: adenylyl-sulfate kinase [Alphaproteobacteria bacterium]